MVLPRIEELSMAVKTAKSTVEIMRSRWIQRKFLLFIINMKCLPYSFRLNRCEWLLRCTGSIKDLRESACIIVKLLYKTKSDKDEECAQTLTAKLIEIYDIMTIAEPAKSNIACDHILSMPEKYLQDALDACVNVCSMSQSSVSPRFLDLYAKLLLIDLNYNTHFSDRRINHLNNAADWLLTPPERLLNKVLVLHPWLVQNITVGGRVCNVFAGLPLLQKISILCDLVVNGALIAAHHIQSVSQNEGSESRLQVSNDDMRSLLQSAVDKLWERCFDEEPTSLAPELLCQFLTIAMDFKPRLTGHGADFQEKLKETSAGVRLLHIIPVAAIV